MALAHSTRIFHVKHSEFSGEIENRQENHTPAVLVSGFVIKYIISSTWMPMLLPHRGPADWAGSLPQRCPLQEVPGVRNSSDDVRPRSGFWALENEVSPPIWWLFKQEKGYVFPGLEVDDLQAKPLGGAP